MMVSRGNYPNIAIFQVSELIFRIFPDEWDFWAGVYFGPTDWFDTKSVL
jgi:hypothetical protein